MFQWLPTCTIACHVYAKQQYRIIPNETQILHLCHMAYLDYVVTNLSGQLGLFKIWAVLEVMG